MVVDPITPPVGRQHVAIVVWEASDADALHLRNEVALYMYTN